MKKEIFDIGFSPQKEEVFLARLVPQLRRVNLEQELKTQLAEDFGLVEFTLKYSFDNNCQIIEQNSGQKIVELTNRGGVDEETTAIKAIEKGLSRSPTEMWVHFSPLNTDLGYASNCVDFWRLIDNKIVWNRIVVKENFEEMNRIRTFISGEKMVTNRQEMLAAPIATNLSMAEIFPLFELNRSQNRITFDMIKKVVDKCIVDFDREFGGELTNSRDLIFRLYSVCYEAIKNQKVLLNRNIIKNFMYCQLKEQRQENSFGCSATTTIGVFGEKIGYFVLQNGQVKYGEIPKDYKLCEECGCWYFGEKCPFC